MEPRMGRYLKVWDKDERDASGAYVELQDLLDIGWRVRSQERGISDAYTRYYLEKGTRMAGIARRLKSWTPEYFVGSVPA